MKSAFENQTILDSDKDSCSRLRDAVRTKDKSLVHYLLKKGTNVNGIGKNLLHCTPLHLAVSSRCPEIVELLLSEGADSSLRCGMGDTPLTLAATMGSTILIDLLLSYNVQNVENPQSELSHLHIACMRNNLEVVKKLVSKNHGKNVNNTVDKDSMCWASYTALHFAAQYGCTETAEFLLKSGANILAKDERNLTPLHVANLHRNEGIIDLILTAHKQIYDNPADPNGLSHFHIACSRNNVSVVKHFLNLGVDVNQSGDGWRAIDFASYYECPDVIKALLETNVQLEGTRIARLSKCASGLQGEATYDLCVKERVKFKRRYKSCMPAFYRICVKDDIKFIENLVNIGMFSVPSTLHDPSWTQINPLHLAVRHKSMKVIDYLLDHGGDITVLDEEGKTPLHIAFEKELQEVVDKITERLSSSPVNSADYQGLSLFHIICTTSKLTVIEKFLSNGVDINAQVGPESTRWAGFTPLHFAVEFREPEVVDLLLKSGADISIENLLGLNPFDLLINDMNAEHSYPRPRNGLNTISDILLVILPSLSSGGKKIDSKGMSVLHALCIGYCDDGADMHNYLITHQSEINQTINWPQSRHYHKCTPLHLAMENGAFDQSQLLVDNGADLLALNGQGQTPLEFAIKLGYSVWRSAIYEDKLAVFRNKSSIEVWSRPTHFHFACIVGLVENVRGVLNIVSDENLKLSCLHCRNDAGQTPLHTLLLEDIEETSVKPEMIQLLLNNGADVDSKDNDLKTPLHCAEAADSSVPTQILINYGADVNAQDLYGQTPMHCCLFNSEKTCVTEKVTLLLENGADVNIVDERGRTCLMMKKDSFASEDIFRNVATILLKHVKKLQVIGSFISNENKLTYAHLFEDSDRPFNETAFVDRCVEELVEMMLVDIDNHTTLRNLLFKRLNALTPYCNNNSLQNTITSDDFLSKYPIYGSIIKFRMKKAEIRRSLLQEAVIPLNLLLKGALPHECLLSILIHLNNTEDLENVCLSAQMLEQNDKM